MKKITTLILVAVVAIGCSEDFLETTPQGTLFSSTYFKTEGQVEEALIATYDVLGHQKGIDLAFAPHLLVTAVLSDESYAGGQDAGDGFGQDELNRFDVSTGNPIAHSIWKKNYTGVYRANFTIQKANELVNTTDAFKAQIIAEAKFLRAYFYFDQVRFFENIVLTTVTQSPSEANIPQADPRDVYSQIVTDLVDAITDLPESHGANLGRATKWAAQALLGRVYLFENGMYGNGLVTTDGTNIDETYVLNQLEDIISNSGHDLLPSYADVFIDEFSIESVFEISYAGAPVGGDWGTEHFVEGNLGAQMMGPRIAGSSIYYRGWSFGIPSHKLFLALSGDPRLPSTILTQSDLTAESGVSLSDINTGAFQHTGYYNAKYTTKNSELGPEGTLELHNTTNHRVIRFSEVLLMAAEIGSNASYIDRVRMRVGLPSIGAYSDVALQQERVLELALEGERYFDLLRTGNTNELNINNVIGPNYTGPASVYDVTYDPAKRGFLPIPQTEIDLSNNVLVQNAGY